jgi:hypothetical protein
MLRLLWVTLLLAAVPGLAQGQAVGVLRIKVTVMDAARTPVPIARHALLVSDNPNTSAPRRILTAPDGTAEVRLPPGNYTVESDEPLIFNGKAYQWTETLNITAGRVVNLDLTAEKAEVGDAPASAASTGSNDSAPLLPRWKDSLVAIWTPRSRATGFVADTAGLVVTSQIEIGHESAVDVQVSPSVKVAARVLVADAMRNVAVLWIDPAITASVRPLPLACADGGKRDLARGQRLVALGLPIHGQPDSSPGELLRTESRASVADFRLAPGSFGGPVFDTTGVLFGVSSVVDDQDERRRTARVVPVEAVCEAMTSAASVRQTAQKPDSTRLPVEPLQPFPADALAAAAKAFNGDIGPYKFSTAEFDVAFLTPVVVYRAQQRTQTVNGRAGGGSARTVETLENQPMTVTDFGDWSDYFEDAPPVLAVRVTPKLAEGFWTTVARGAAYTQGVRVPSIKRFKPGFARLQLFCGNAEVAPIHPFLLEQRVSETDAVREGLYVFDARALGPHCGSVKLTLYSEKDPKKQDARIVDAQLVERIWQDFAPYRATLDAAGK